jgi:hypothetical protein
LLVIREAPELVKAYDANFDAHQAHSTPYVRKNANAALGEGEEGEVEGMAGLFDQEPDLVHRCDSVSEAVRQEFLRLKTLYPPLNLRETANIIYATSRIESYNQRSAYRSTLLTHYEHTAFRMPARRGDDGRTLHGHARHCRSTAKRRF